MSMLQGTLETLALPEVLGLLGHSRKTGALWLDATGASAALYLVEGRCCAAESSDAGEPVDDGRALLARVVDICFAVARVEGGTFRFGPESPSWTCSETVDLEAVNDAVGRLVEEWGEIQAVIPSLECRVRLAEELGVPQLAIDGERWKLLVALDGRRTVRELVRRTNRPVLDVCHAILELVDAGAVEIGPPPVAPASAKPRARAVDSAVEPEAPYGPGVESPHPGPAWGEDGREVGPLEKRHYMRAFSAVQES
jgi:hypothetical protein